MTPLVTRYPLDPTGVNPENLVAAEPHTLSARRIRAVATQYGAFFSESLQIKDVTNNAILVKGQQFYAAELYELPTARYGKEVCAIVLITDENVGPEIELTYQALGGEFSNSMTAISQQIDKLKLDERPVGWGDLIARPDEFPPSHHLHDVGDVYGFEYLVHSLDRVRAAIIMGDDISHDAIYAYIDQEIAKLVLQGQSTAQSLASHLVDYNNPHNVTPDQINVYTKPAVDTQLTALNTSLTNSINTHTSARNNPHVVTAAQVGAYTKVESDTLLNQARTTLTNSINNHTARTDNPHNVTPDQLSVYTKAQVDATVSTLTTTMNAGLAAASKVADWKGITGLNSATLGIQTFAGYPSANVTMSARPSMFYVMAPDVSALSIPPQQFPSNSVVGFDAYSSSDLGSCKVGIVVTGISNRQMQLISNWNFEELAPSGGLSYRVNDDTGDVTKWGALTTLWDSRNLTKLSDLENDLKLSGARGGGADLIFYENDQVVTTDYSITPGKNAMSAGPITIADGADVVIPTGSVWTIV